MSKREGTPPKLEANPKHLLAIEALMSGKGVNGAMAAAKVSRATMYSWLNNDAFKSEMRKRFDAVDAAIEARLIDLVDKTMGSLEKLLTVKRIDKNVVMARGIAAQRILEHYRWMWERSHAKGDGDSPGGAGAGGFVLRIEPMTAEQMAAAREEQRRKHEEGGLDDGA